MGPVLIRPVSLASSTFLAQRVSLRRNLDLVYRRKSSSHKSVKVKMAGDTLASLGPRRFAPLKEGAEESDAPKLKGIIFDMDGTLCEPQSQMFRDMRAALSIPPTTDILAHISALPTPAAQASAHAAIQAIETRYMRLQTPQPGLTELMAYLEAKKLPKGICTRNFAMPVTHLCEKFLEGVEFKSIVTREFEPAKPHPAPLLYIAGQWGLFSSNSDGSNSSTAKPVAVVNGQQDWMARGEGWEGKTPDASGLIMVGDSMDDMLAGRGAGAATVLLANEENGHVASSGMADLVIKRLDELVGVLEEGFVGGVAGVDAAAGSV